MKNVDKTDLAILRALMKNARASYREVASQIGVAVGTVQHRMQKLEKKGILKGFRPVIDYSKLGYEVAAIISLETPRGLNEELEEKLAKNPHVNSIYHTAGDVDIFIRVKFKHTDELHQFLQTELTDKYVKKSKTYIIMDKKRAYGKLMME
ncbi:Lrp/AsnC family transcriptional regulator [archaeon]